MRVLVLAGVLAASLPAQSKTSPLGLDAKEGNTVFYHWGGTTGRQMRVYDNTQLKRPKVLRTLAFRRNGTATNAGGARKLDVKLVIAELDMTVISTDMDAPLPGGKTVLDAKQINFPDWSGGTQNPPAAFDFVLKLSAPLVLQNRKAFAWDLVYKNATVAASAQMDRDYQRALTATGQLLGTGCSGMTHGMRLENNGPGAKSYGMRLRLEAASAPPNAPGWVFVDFKDQNLRLSVVCTAVHALPQIQIPLKANASGAVPRTYVSFPHIPVAQGVTFVTQYFAIDAAIRPIPLRISNGRTATMPTNSTTAGHEACYGWRSNGRTASFLFFGGCPITELK